MAFCSNCGNTLTGKERFCAQCGADVSAKTAAAGAPSSPPPAAPVPPPAAQVFASAPQPATQAFASAPPQYVAPAQGPVVVAVPPGQAPAGAQNRNSMLGTIIVIVIVAGLVYYYYSKSHPGASTPASNPPTASQPASQPGAPSAPPPAGSGSGGNAALVNQQAFNAHWQSENGFLVLTTATWANNSAVALTSAVVQCEQDDANGADLSQYRVTLNGPTNANATSSYSNIRIGAFIANTAKVNCTIVHVKPAS